MNYNKGNFREDLLLVDPWFDRSLMKWFDDQEADLHTTLLRARHTGSMRTMKDGSKRLHNSTLKFFEMAIWRKLQFAGPQGLPLKQISAARRAYKAVVAAWA